MNTYTLTARLVIAMVLLKVVATGPALAANLDGAPDACKPPPTASTARWSCIEAIAARGRHQPQSSVTSVVLDLGDKKSIALPHIALRLPDEAKALTVTDLDGHAPLMTAGAFPKLSLCSEVNSPKCVGYSPPEQQIPRQIKLPLNRDYGVLWGIVRFPSGGGGAQPPVREGKGPEQIESAATVAAFSTTGLLKAGPVSVNSAGEYVMWLPTATPEKFDIKVNFDGKTALEKCRFVLNQYNDLKSATACDIDMTVQKPEATVSVNYHARSDTPKNPEPAYLELTGSAKQPGPPLFFSWGDNLGRNYGGSRPEPRSTDSVQWPLQSGREPRSIYLLVRDGNGGWNRVECTLKLPYDPGSANLCASRERLGQATIQTEQADALRSEQNLEFNFVNTFGRAFGAGVPYQPSPFYQGRSSDLSVSGTDLTRDACTVHDPTDRTGQDQNTCMSPAMRLTYHFGDPVLMMGCRDGGNTKDLLCLREAVSYYRSLGIYTRESTKGPPRPQWPFRSFGEWKQWAFGGEPAANSDAVTVANVSYHNSPDLALGRDMHCIRYNKPKTDAALLPELVAILECYVANYGDGKTPAPGSDPAKGAWNAAAGDAYGEGQNAARPASGAHDQVAVVAMQSLVFARTDGKGSAASEVSFHVFAPPANGSDRSIERFQVSPQVLLDAEGPKALPGACLPCHGGIYLKGNDVDNHEMRSVAGARFLPFDVATVGVTPDPRSYQESFRKLNALVRESSVGEPYLSARLMTDLIDGWYGKDAKGGPCSVHIPGCAFNGEFVPLQACSDQNDPPSCGWQSQRELYTSVIAKYCRYCHMSWASLTYNPQNQKSFSGAAHIRTALPDYTTLVTRPHGAVQCKQQWLMPFLINQERVMPYAEQPYRDFWADRGRAADQLRGAFWEELNKSPGGGSPKCEDKIWPSAVGTR